jgi:hypothetical protein
MHTRYTTEAAAAIAAAVPDDAGDRLAAVAVILTGEPGDLCGAIADTSPIVYGSRIVYPHALDRIASGPADDDNPGTAYAWAAIVRRDHLADMAERVAAVARVENVAATVIELAGA